MAYLTEFSHKKTLFENRPVTACHFSEESCTNPRNVSINKERGIAFFSFIVFGGTEVPIVYILLSQGLPDGSSSKDWQSTVGWGDCWIRTQDCSFTIWCCYHCHHFGSSSGSLREELHSAVLNRVWQIKKALALSSK
jgi:hypothetical protein